MPTTPLKVGVGLMCILLTCVITQNTTPVHTWGCLYFIIVQATTNLHGCCILGNRAQWQSSHKHVTPRFILFSGLMQCMQSHINWMHANWSLPVCYVHHKLGGRTIWISLKGLVSSEGVKTYSIFCSYMWDHHCWIIYIYICLDLYSVLSFTSNTKLKHGPVCKLQRRSWLHCSLIPAPAALQWA